MASLTVSATVRNLTAARALLVLFDGALPFLIAGWVATGSIGIGRVASDHLTRRLRARRSGWNRILNSPLGIVHLSIVRFQLRFELVLLATFLAHQISSSLETLRWPS